MHESPFPFLQNFKSDPIVSGDMHVGEKCEDFFPKVI
jgi:hypothetical protein